MALKCTMYNHWPTNYVVKMHRMSWSCPWEHTKLQMRKWALFLVDSCHHWLLMWTISTSLQYVKYLAEEKKHQDEWDTAEQRRRCPWAKHGNSPMEDVYCLFASFYHVCSKYAHSKARLIKRSRCNLSMRYLFHMSAVWSWGFKLGWWCGNRVGWEMTHDSEP